MMKCLTRKIYFQKSNQTWLTLNDEMSHPEEILPKVPIHDTWLLVNPKGRNVSPERGIFGSGWCCIWWLKGRTRWWAGQLLCLWIVSIDIHKKKAIHRYFYQKRSKALGRYSYLLHAEAWISKLNRVNSSQFLKYIFELIHIFNKVIPLS